MKVHIIDGFTILLLRCFTRDVVYFKIGFL
jgi:hypothetical protein